VAFIWSEISGKKLVMLHTSLARRIHFSSAHLYARPEWSPEKNREVFGSCFSEKGHGHNYILEVHISGPLDPETGMIINLRDLDILLKKVTDPLDHHHLNYDLEYFKDRVPTTEVVAQYLWQELSGDLKAFAGLKIDKVVLYEGDDLWVELSP
jgi:6-pyruvoyltetrahydropterin/6-carboxytetrahydropterin synthase